MFGGLSDEDREMAVDVLKRRLEHTDLRAVLQALDNGRRKPVEEIVVTTEREHHGPGRPRKKLPDTELAELLVDRLGIELLDNATLRMKLAYRATDDERRELHDYEHGRQSRRGKAAQAEAIGKRKWHPGKSWPRRFVRILDFPAAFAGSPGSPQEPPTLEVIPFEPLPELADFQKDLKEQAESVLEGTPGKNRAVLTMPTGAGKTRTAVEALLSWRLRGHDRAAILWIAQSEELCEQAVQAFSEVWTDLGQRPERVREPLTVARFWGASRPVPDDSGVIVASIQKLLKAVRTQDENQQQALTVLREAIGAIVVDEAHRIDADSYREVLNFLGAGFPSSTSPTPLLGLTATPFRAGSEDSQRLSRIFDGRLLRAQSLGEDMVGALRARRVLAEVDHELLDYDAPLLDLERSKKYTDYFEQFNEFHPDFLREVSEDDRRNRALFQRLMQLSDDWPTLFFGCTVEHAQAMTVLLRRMGRSAAVITGRTRGATRRALIEDFHRGQISVLCNFGVLTTGFDAPKVRALVIGRPTTSRVLYEQMIGRGIRGPEFNGTDRCAVIDVQDNIKFHGKLAYEMYSRYWQSG